MTELSAPVPYDANRHRTEQFDSSEPRLDRWLQNYAGQGQRRDASRTFVVVDEQDHVVAYYTLIAGEVDHAEASSDVRRGMSSHFPIPVCVLARLAVDRRHQGRGVGGALLADALARAARAAEQVGMRAVVDDALHARASEFYQRFGLQPVTEDGLTLMVTLEHIRQAAEVASGDLGTGHKRDPEWQELRDEWALSFALLGGYGHRPKLDRRGLVLYRADRSTLTISGAAGQLPMRRSDTVLRLTLRGADGIELYGGEAPFEGDAEIIALVRALFEAHPEGHPPDEAFIRHFPPATEHDRMCLITAFGCYRPELDALAAAGIHAYLEDSGFSIRIYSDVSSNLLLDVSLDDEGLPVLGPDEGEWVVFLTAPDGHEAEFTVDRYGDDRVQDAELLAEAVTHALGRVLRGGHVFLEHYDPERGRLDPHWIS